MGPTEVTWEQRLDPCPWVDLKRKRKKCYFSAYYVTGYVLNSLHILIYVNHIYIYIIHLYDFLGQNLVSIIRMYPTSLIMKVYDILRMQTT